MMRKLKGILASSSTFFAGVTIYFVFLNFAIEESKILVQPPRLSSSLPVIPLPVIPLCEVEDNFDFYRSKQIRAKAKVYAFDGERILAFDLKKGCGSVNIEFYNDENESLSRDEMDSDVLRLINDLRQRNPEELDAMAEVELTGEMAHSGILCDFSGRIKPFTFKTKSLIQTSEIKRINISEELDRINDYEFRIRH